MKKDNCSLFDYDVEQLEGYASICGVDEAGRGPLAGPVSAAAVFLNASFYEGICDKDILGFNDSKQLNEAQRERCFAQIKELSSEGKLSFASAMCDVSEIETYNILGATGVAMNKALESLENLQGICFSKRGENNSEIIMLVDGRPMKVLLFEHKAVVKGDAKSLAIAMASIVAKVTRDHLMQELHKLYPVYGFNLHKGYGTKKHREAILKYGPCSAHRPTFLRKILAEKKQAELDLSEN